MDISCLRVMNSLYDLKITDEQFTDIEEEVSHKERTGVSVKVVLDDKVVCVEHDEKHIITIRQISDFDSKIKLVSKSRILLKTLITFEDLPNEVYALHRIGSYRADDKKIKRVASNLEELKEKILERFCDKYTKRLADEWEYREFQGCDLDAREQAKKRKFEVMDKQLRAIYWLFGQEFNFEFDNTRKNISKIIKVFEKNNIRLAVIQVNEEFEKSYGMFNGNQKELCEGVKAFIQVFKLDDKRYNYTDVGREIYGTTNEAIWICNDELTGKITEEELELINRKTENNFLLLTKDTYEMYKDSLRVEMMTARRQERENATKEKFREKMEEQLLKGEVVREGITITPKSVTYDGITLKGEDVEKYIQWESLHTRENLDFKNIFLSIIDLTLGRERYAYGYTMGEIEVKMKGKKKLSVGKIQILVEKSEHSKAFFINDIKVRTDELHKLISLALNFKEQKEYDLFLKSVSKESLRVKQALKEGITFNFNTKPTRENCVIQKEGKASFNLHLEKINEKLNLRVGEQFFQIKDINSLFDLPKVKDNTIERTCKLLYKAIKDINPQVVGDLIKLSEKELKEKIARSEEFIKNAVKLTNATKIDKGYVVKGESGRNYFVGDDLKVFQMEGNKPTKYICIVDLEDVKDQAQHNDFIAKRLLALNHDTKMSKEIFTLEFK